MGVGVSVEVLMSMCGCGCHCEGLVHSGIVDVWMCALKCKYDFSKILKAKQ